MRHDTQWLYERTGYTTEEDAGLARSYHEHMQKWRSLDELPEWGDWIEVLCNELGDIHTITYGPGRFKDTDLGWRPAMQLPNST